jgi:hypothetical protein
VTWRSAAQRYVRPFDLGEEKSSLASTSNGENLGGSGGLSRHIRNQTWDCPASGACVRMTYGRNNTGSGRRSLR